MQPITINGGAVLIALMRKLATGVGLVALMAVGREVASADDAPATPAAVALAGEGRYAEAVAALRGDGAQHDPEALQALARAVLVRGIDSPDAFERWAAMRAARGIPDPALAPPALRQLESDGRYEQALALEILARAAPEASFAAFVTALDSPHRTVRLRALRALHGTDQRPALEERIGALVTEDPDPDVRVVAVRTLRDWHAFGAIPRLREAVSDPAPAVRQEAVAALVLLGDPEIAALVRQRLAEVPPEERARTLRLAGRVPSRSLLPVVSPFLSDSDPEVRSAAAAAVLTITGAEHALP